MAHYDLVIIGSGSGNSLVTPDLDDWQIAIVEESVFGGTCLNVGCIPTKMYVYPAGIAESLHEAPGLGVDAELQDVRWRDMRDRIFGRIDAISAGGRDYRAHGTPNVKLYEAHAHFVDPHTLALSTGETITADRVVLAAGSRATVPPVIADGDISFHTSDTVMRIDALPNRIAILGGGYISAEFAHIFSAFGSQVSVFTRGPGLLRELDDEISERFTIEATKRWDVRLNETGKRVERRGDGVRIILTDNSTIDADLLLVATGRVPNSDRMNLENAGVEVDADGLVVVDAYQRTRVEHIWALGDISSPYQLKHVANHEARVVAHNLAHPDDLVAADHRFVPAAVFTHPQVASVGLTEQDARARGVNYVAALQHFGGTAYGWAMEDQTSVCKLLADPVSGQLLGAHLMGHEASILIQPLIQAMSFGLGVREMARGQYWIHPALTEVVENALLKLELA
jgi:mycothione reductase